MVAGGRNEGGEELGLWKKKKNPHHRPTSPCSIMISPRPTLPQLLRANYHYCRPPLPPTAATTIFAAGFRCSGPFPPDSGETHLEIRNGTRRDAVNGSSRVKVKVSNSLLKEKWLDSMLCPFPLEEDRDVGLVRREAGSGMLSEWVVGVDPDVSGALALLKPDGSGYSAQVYDTPHLQVLVGKRARKRPDAKSIVLLLQSLGAPCGTNAYIEQSTPFPKDGKQGWWSGGYTYGLWIGVLVASGFSVVPVTSRAWKDHFGLSGGRLNKDDSRHTASLLFPSTSSFLQRKKDHGRAEALLIAAYGNGLSVPESSDHERL